LPGLNWASASGRYVSPRRIMGRSLMVTCRVVLAPLGGVGRDVVDGIGAGEAGYALAIQGRLRGVVAVKAALEV